MEEKDRVVVVTCSDATPVSACQRCGEAFGCWIFQRKIRPRL